MKFHSVFGIDNISFGPIVAAIGGTLAISPLIPKLKPLRGPNNGSPSLAKHDNQPHTQVTADQSQNVLLRCGCSTHSDHLASSVSRPAQYSFKLRPARSLSRQSNPIQQGHQRFRRFCRCLGCYRAERSSCRAGFSPTDERRLFMAHGKVEISVLSDFAHIRPNPFIRSRDIGDARSLHRSTKLVQAVLALGLSRTILMLGYTISFSFAFLPNVARGFARRCGHELRSHRFCSTSRTAPMPRLRVGHRTIQRRRTLSNNGELSKLPDRQTLGIRRCDRKCASTTFNGW